MKHRFETLPVGYEQILAIDLMKNKKLALLVNGLAVLIMIAMIVPALFIVPIENLFDFSQGMGMYFLRFGVLVVSSFLYIIVHEWVHGIAMKYYGAKKVRYGFHGIYASACCDDYFDKKSYLVIALAPVVVWGIVFLILQLFANAQWFWVVWTLQIFNISGAAGDLYVTVRFSRLPKDILIGDYGVGMAVYAKK